MEEFGVKDVSKVKGNAYINWLIEDGILYLKVKKTDEFNLQQAKVCVRDLEEYTNYKPYPCLMSVVEIKAITKEARDYFAHEGDTHILANAMLVSSPIMKMISNFYIMVNSPRKPTRMFTDLTRALEWLSQFRNKA
jgi:hypothetical protein